MPSPDHALYPPFHHPSFLLPPSFSPVALPIPLVNLCAVPLTCQKCGGRPATIHLTEVSQSGNHAEAHLCVSCCQEAGWTTTTLPPPIAALLASKAESTETASEGDDGTATCSTCGLRFSEYQQVNLFGCAHDWTTFSTQITGLIRRWHGATAHTGRRPGEAGPAAADAERAGLEADLAVAVAEERYEVAARLRDQLRRLHVEPS